MAETFKLPCSSYEELIKLFQAYANTKEGTALSLDEITQATGVPRTIVSKNNGFMVQVGLITEGNKKAGIIEAALRSANITENSLRTYWGENLYTFVNTSNVFAPLVEALQKTHSGTMDVRSIVVCAANAFESFLADFAIRKGVSLSGRNGILQKRDALSAHISKKHRGMIEFVGQVRNAADHGADPDENNQVWTISNETARIYPCIIAALIKAIFSRDATGSIEV